MQDGKAVEDFLPLKPNWLHILLALAGQEQHGYAIMQEVSERTDGKLRLWPATLYGTIRQLSEAGLIEKGEERPTEDDDPRRRYYRLTEMGDRVLAAEARRLQTLAELVQVRRQSRRAESP